MTPATLTMIREAERLSRAAFAKRLGISRNSLAAYEGGRKAVPAYVALAATAVYRRCEPVE